MNRKTIVLVGCSKSKSAAPHIPAKDLYQGELFKKSREFAEKNSYDWWILSALHDFLHPEFKLSAYNLTLNDMSRAERINWSGRVYCQLSNPERIPPGSRVIILAGEKYREFLIPLLESIDGVAIETPLARLGIGQQLSYLKRAVSVQEKLF